MIADLAANPAVIVAIATGVLGPVAVVLATWAANQRKSKAGAALDVAEARHTAVEGDVSVAGVVLRWSEGLREELAIVKAEILGLREQVGKLERENRALRRHNQILTEQVVGLGGTPLAMPED